MGGNVQSEFLLLLDRGGKGGSVASFELHSGNKVGYQVIKSETGE
jgi:hypothetical protein